MIDSNEGELKAMRVVGLSTMFSRKIKEAIENQLGESFNKEDYLGRINRIFASYSTKDMVGYSEALCIIRKT